MITQQELKEYLEYNPDTGEFTWIKKLTDKVVPGQLAGSLTNHKHRLISFNKERIAAHRLAFLYMKGYIPTQVDHIDNNPLNNKWNNLRECTQKQNSYNLKVFRKNNTSGYKGVSWFEPRKKWTAYITVNYTKQHLGYFNTKEEAAQIYNKAAKKHFGKFAKENVI